MPLYAYNCQNCDADFELLVHASDVPVCPSCGSEKLQQLVAKICGEIRNPALAKAGRQAAARSGHLSNFSRQERQTKKS